MYSDEVSINSADTINLSRDNRRKLTVAFTRDVAQTQDYFTFKTSINNVVHRIDIRYSSILILKSQIKAKEPITIQLTESYADSLAVVFPPGGTSTSVLLLADSTNLNPQRKKLTFDGNYESLGNSLYLSKSDIGKYHVYYSSCHWGSEFELIVK